MSSFIQELRRRNIFRVAGVYALVGWLLMQIVSVMTPALALPDWVDSFFAILLLIGFPLAILLTWAFEMTPEGMKRTETVTGGERVAAKTGRMLDIVIITGLALLIGSLVVGNRFMPQKTITPDSIALEETLPADEKPSIAVLPFADLSPNKDQGYFSDGMAEEILNVLVRVEGLSVSSRTSSFQFKGLDAIGIPLIAKKLNVRHVLEGSVRKSGNMIRITAQLIDAQTDQHLWSQTFDRTLTTENIFAIQDEIANEIVDRLGIVIDGENNGAPAISVRAGTENLDAYELYLEANALFTVRNKANLPKIIALYEAVVADDPDFARAWAGLAGAYNVAPDWDVIDRDYAHLSETAARRAISLNPNLAMPYAVLAGRGRGNSYADMFANLDKALVLDPKEVNALQWRGEAWLAAGFFDKAEADFKRCIEIDPNFLQCRMWIAKTKFYRGETDEGFALYEHAVSMGGIGAGALHWPLEYAHAGDFRAARLVLAAVCRDFFCFNGRSDRLYRALTDPDFDFAKEAAVAEVEWHAGMGDDRDLSGMEAFYFKKYDALKPSFNSIWWVRTDPVFLKSPHRKRLIREAGVYDYWQKAGFPPQCKPVGENDFECD
jgi:TolB-like protein/Tfp pilus assembly protein PilF